MTIVKSKRTNKVRLQGILFKDPFFKGSQTVDKLDKIEFAYSLFLFKIFINRYFRGDG